MASAGISHARDCGESVCEKESMTQLKDHPIMITLSDAIAGAGFLAGIVLSGRALVRQEEDGKWWMYGVRPAALAESGKTVEDAFLRFRARYQEVLFDFAEEASNFEEFKKAVERFFSEPDADDEDERAWDNALKAIRAEGLNPPEEFSGLPRQVPESTPSRISVEQLNDAEKRFTSSDNVKDTYSFPCSLAA